VLVPQTISLLQSLKVMNFLRKYPQIFKCALIGALVLFTASPTSWAQQAESRQLEHPEPVKSWPSKAKRWALVMGVDQYTDPQISALKGAANDARNLADALVRYAGFPADQVILLATDQPQERQPTRLNILRRLSNLSSLVPKDGLLLVSFAGHGIERGGQAYLIPSDSQLTDDVSLLEESAVSVARMHDRIKGSGVGQIVVLLDACRNDPGGRADAPNPLTQSYVNGFNFDVRNREVTAFATIYATAVGQRAYEYTEKKQGYFTWAIVEGLKGGAANERGEVTLAGLVKYVQENVPKRVAIDLGAGKPQRPFYQMEGYKAEELVIAVGGYAAANPTSAASSVDPAAIELSYWESIAGSGNVEDFRAYLKEYPAGRFASIAKNRIATLEAAPSVEARKPEASASATELAYWDSVKNSTNADDLQAYLRKYPQGEFAELANNRLKALESATSKPNPAASSVEVLSFRGTFGAKMALSSFEWQGSLRVGPDWIKFECENDTKFCKIGQIRPFTCQELAKAVADKEVIREIAIDRYKYRFTFRTATEATSALAAMRKVCGR
jgi:hypothetical protein